MNHILKLAALSTIGCLALSSIAFAADNYNVSNGLTNNGNPLAIHGTDPVMLLNTGKENKGYDKYSVVHEGVEFYFASAETKAKFAANPAAFIPEYNGFCVLGIAKGKKLDGDTRYLDIVDGKVYLFVNAAVIEIYNEDKAGTIAKANEIWKEIQNTPIEDL